MFRNLQSFPSIEVSLEEEIKQQEKDQHSKHQYLLNLKTQCQIRETALRTAQALVQAYQKENQQLKEENSYLKAKLTEIEEKVSSMEEESETLKSMQKTLFKYSQKINQLLENNLTNQHKIHALQRQLERAKETNEGELLSMKAKAKLKSRQQKQRKELESHFQNNYQIKYVEEAFSSKEKRPIQKQVRSSDKKVLQWKLKQKDEQVLILLKRLKEKQEKLDHVVGKRYPTYDSFDFASTKQSKKMNGSQIEH